MKLTGNYYYGDCFETGRLKLTDEMAQVVTSIEGYVSVCKGASLSLPVCTSIGGSVAVYEDASLSLPVCTSIGGRMYAI